MKTMKYKYRLYPTIEQENMLVQICGAQRYIWNCFLDLEQKRYKDDGKFNFAYANCKTLTSMKKETDWLKTIPSTSLQQTILYLDRALKQSFRGKSSRRGFPKFKSKHHNNNSFSLVMVNRDSAIKDGCFVCPKIGKIKTIFHRELTSDFKSCQIKQEKNGHWFVVFTVKRVCRTKVSKIKNIIGLDFNSQNIIVDSNGKEYKNPKFFAKAKEKLAKDQRRLSKKQKGSSNRNKARLKVAASYAKVSRQRKDFLDKLSSKIVHNNDLICIEDLNVAGMSKFNGRMVQDVGWSALRTMLEYKAELYGKHVSVIDRYFPSSKMCSGCGQLRDKSLSERHHDCDCGLSISRDHNAGINIRNEGLDLFRKTIGQELSNFKLVEIV